MKLLRTLLACSILCAGQAALAVKPGAVSRTAQSVCWYRAIAATHPDPKLRNPDDLATKLCPLPLPFQYEYPQVRRFIDNSGETYSSYFYVNARTHHIDAVLRRAAAEGVEQVVVMGAGFDSRAYRFRASHPGLRFFEVDLPATSEEKRRRVAAAIGELPQNVRYAPIDFNTQRLEDVLPPLGYDRSRRSFFLLEGVVMYVVEPGLDATFDFIRRNAAPGSVVVYDYVLRDVIQGKYGKYYAAGSTAAAVAGVGEPYVTGWTPRGAAAFVRKHGLKVVEDVDHKQLTRRYLTGTDGKPDGRVHDWLRIIEARVQ
jgi:methyltransferase (TIGR00027 family)